MTTITITLTHSKDTKGNDITQPVCPVGHIELAVDKRTPARTYRAYIPAAYWPNVDDVPSDYRPLVQAALITAGETILKSRLDTVGLDSTFIPLDTLTLEKLLSASATQGRMTGDSLLSLWKQTSKYILDVAPKLATLQGSQLLKYKATLERFETSIKALVSPTAENKLSEKQLDAIMIAIKTEDQDTAYAAYVARRTEEIRTKLAEQDEAI